MIFYIIKFLLIQGAFMIHKWASVDALPGNLFLLEKTEDINCKNKDGLTAFQIIVSAILNEEDDEEKEFTVAKLKLLLQLKPDTTISKDDMIALSTYIQSEYDDDEDLTQLLDGWQSTMDPS